MGLLFKRKKGVAWVKLGGAFCHSEPKNEKRGRGGINECTESAREALAKPTISGEGSANHQLNVHAQHPS